MLESCGIILFLEGTPPAGTKENTLVDSSPRTRVRVEARARARVHAYTRGRFCARLAPSNAVAEGEKWPLAHPRMPGDDSLKKGRFKDTSVLRETLMGTRRFMRLVGHKDVEVHKYNIAAVTIRNVSVIVLQ